MEAEGKPVGAQKAAETLCASGKTARQHALSVLSALSRRCGCPAALSPKSWILVSLQVVSAAGVVESTKLVERFLDGRRSYCQLELLPCPVLNCLRQSCLASPLSQEEPGEHS